MRSNTKLRDRANQPGHLACRSTQECAYAIAIATQALPPIFEHSQAVSDRAPLSLCLSQRRFQTLNLLLDVCYSASHYLFALHHLLFFIASRLQAETLFN